MKNIKPGDIVYIVQRDEYGDASSVYGFIFVAEATDTVIVTPKVYGCKGLAEVMKYHCKETARDCELLLGVYPAGDCYRTKYGAVCALKEEMEATT